MNCDIAIIARLRFIAGGGNGWSPQSREVARELRDTLKSYGFKGGDVKWAREQKDIQTATARFEDAINGAIHYVDSLETGKSIPPIPDAPRKVIRAGKWAIATALGAEALGITHGAVTNDGAETTLFALAGGATAVAGRATAKVAADREDANKPRGK